MVARSPEAIERRRLRDLARVKARSSARKKATRAVLRVKVLFMYGSKCACCGEDEEAFLTVDHVNGDGAEHRRSLPPAGLYQWLVDNNFPEGFRLLCWNCNNALFRRGACPHGNL